MIENGRFPMHQFGTCHYIFSSLSSIPKYTFLFQRKKEKNALRSKKKWFRWHFPPLQKAKIRGVKGRMKGEKRGIS